jgi:hypothetical protein
MIEIVVYWGRGIDPRVEVAGCTTEVAGFLTEIILEGCVGMGTLLYTRSIFGGRR